ncbi:MAG TPA: hypothetical protein VFP43_13460 [Mesorhizobium sp.]|nr:hypothetical protein [Mesorhizobium sp.]
MKVALTDEPELVLRVRNVVHLEILPASCSLSLPVGLLATKRYDLLFVARQLKRCALASDIEAEAEASQKKKDYRFHISAVGGTDSSWASIRVDRLAEQQSPETLERLL